MPDTSHQDAIGQEIRVERRGAIGLVTLNRPDRINAINDAIRSGLSQALADLDASPDIRVIVLHGGSGRGFCAGADITEPRAPRSPVAIRAAMGAGSWIEAFDRCATPIVAAIHGFCLGGGFEIALACDIRIAAPDAVFALPETGLGLIPGAGGTQRLPRLVGMSRALDLMLTGDRIDAAAALRAGIITRLVEDPSSLLDEALALAERIAARAPAATLYVKEAALSGSDLPLAAGLALERSLFALLSGTADKTEAGRAFAEKRPPRFTGE